MSGARFVRFYPSDWRSGCIGLSLEEEGFYIRVCAFIYETGQRLPASDDSRAAKLIGVHTNAYRKLRDQLAALGKIVRRADGWTVVRAEKELSAATHSQGRDDGHADQNTGWETSQDTVGETILDTSTETPIVFSETPNIINGPLKSQKPIAIKEESPLPPRGPTPTEALQAFEAYNATALRCAIPQAAKLTPDRSRKIIARLKDYGLEGWQTALANIEKSSFLTGKNDKGWTADLEFMLRPANFAKLHDGGYGNGRHAGPPSGFAPTPRRETEDEMQQRIIAELERECMA